MLGKASEIKAIEVETRDINGWMNDHPSATVLDIKYFLVPYTEMVQGGSYALIIYKEGDTE